MALSEEEKRKEADAEGGERSGVVRLVCAWPHVCMNKLLRVHLSLY